MMFGDESAPPASRSASPGRRRVDRRAPGPAGLAGAGGAGGRGARRVRRAGRAPPPPIEVTAEISLEESFHGTSRIVELDGRAWRSRSRAAPAPAAGSG
jgi:hypothetical protein